MAEQEHIGDQMSNLMKEKVREVKAEGLSGNVKVLSRRALMDIVDQLIKSYGGLEHQDLISKIAEFELNNKQLETKMATMQGKLEIYESQVAQLRKEDDDLRAKVKVDDARLPMLEEQNQVYKKTVDGLSAESEVLRRRLAETEEGLKAELERVTAELAEARAAAAEAGPQIEAAQRMKDDAERRVRESDALMRDLQDKVSQVEEAKEKALADSRSKIARLESALQESDARKRILTLENELSSLKSNIEVLDNALEFVDVEPAPRFEEAEAEIGGIEEILAKIPEDSGDAAPVRAAVSRIKSVLARDMRSFPELIGMIYDNQGTISVMRDAIEVFTRQQDLVFELKSIRAAAELI